MTKQQYENMLESLANSAPLTEAEMQAREDALETEWLTIRNSILAHTTQLLVESQLFYPGYAAELLRSLANLLENRNRMREVQR